MATQIKCICGSGKFGEATTHKGFMVDPKGESIKNSIALIECECGLVRQATMPFSTKEQFIDYYEKKYPPTKGFYKAKDYKHDREVAAIRCSEYGINKGKVLDVGSGSGAFVEECRARGAEAYGCEISKYSYSKVTEDAFIYRKCFEDVHFPTDHFDITTCHDVIEHVLDPVAFVEEMFRTTKQDGTCFIEIPRFFHEAGSHHWKWVEHLWYFTTMQFLELLTDIGFEDIKVSHPIESKTLYRMVKPPQERVKVLLPPGIGDSYWSIVKMESLMRREGIEGPVDAYVACPRMKGHDGHLRAFPFLEMFPFIGSTGETFDSSIKNIQRHNIWKEAYSQRGRTIFKDVFGFDYFVSYNGHLRYGESLEGIDPDLKCNWNPPMFVSLEQERYKEQCKKQYGKYIVFYFVFQGTYKHWTDQFSVASVIRFIRDLVERTGYTPVFAGAVWDKKLDSELRRVRKSIPNCVDLLGETTVEQLFGLLRGGELVVGYPSGLTILSAVLKQKTLIIWNGFYDNNFAWECCPPSVRNKTYFIKDTKGLTPEHLTSTALQILGSTMEKQAPRKHEEVRVEQPEQPVKEDSVLTVACVLRSGGVYGPVYANRLKSMVERHLHMPYKFVCLTDVPSKRFGTGIEVVPLKTKRRGWWAKVELFRLPGPVLYFDLDTLILNDITSLGMAAMQEDFLMLTPFKSSELWASGVMAWGNGAYGFLHKNLNQKDIDEFKWDQRYIHTKLRERGVDIHPIQDYTTVFSYKRQCGSGPPEGAQVICFHGRPRLHEVVGGWVEDSWK